MPNISRIVYCAHDGSPALLVYCDGGLVRGFEHDEIAWQEVNPSGISVNAIIFEPALFHQIWPDLALPNLDDVDV